MIATLLFLVARAAAQPATAAPNADADKIICKLETQENSRIPARICLTKSEWDRIQKENSDDYASSRNGRAGGLSGTIVNAPASSDGGLVTGYPAGTNVPGISGRPPH